MYLKEPGHPPQRSRIYQYQKSGKRQHSFFSLTEKECLCLSAPSVERVVLADRAPLILASITLFFWMAPPTVLPIPRGIQL